MIHKALAPLLLLITINCFSQSITLEFPAFAGKTYDFIIFQGSTQETVIQDTIPANGKFTLKIPAQYAPYTGMSRWLITRTEKGGGLDMAIPGHNFSVTCLSAQPNQENIVYKGFNAVNELNRLNTQQKQMVQKFTVTSQAATLYKDHKKFSKLFTKETQKQKKAFAKFHQQLKNNPNFNARFLPIVNLTQGIPPQLTNNPEEKAQIYNQFITQELNFNDLYVSGHWTAIIRDWVGYQSNAVNDKTKFAQDFKQLSARIQSPIQYTDFAGKVTYYLTTYGKDDFVDAIANTVVGSGKITEYLGSLQVYVKAMVGMPAPDLVFTQQLDTITNQKPVTTTVKSSAITQGKNTHTLLLFYQTGCGPCKDLLAALPSEYELLKQKGIDLIAISADTDVDTFAEEASRFLWKRSTCDLKGFEGVNFKNYAVSGTPTMFLIDAKGTIVKKMAALTEVVDWAKAK